MLLLTNHLQRRRFRTVINDHFLKKNVITNNAGVSLVHKISFNQHSFFGMQEAMNTINWY